MILIGVIRHTNTFSGNSIRPDTHWTFYRLESDFNRVSRRGVAFLRRRSILKGFECAFFEIGFENTPPQHAV